MFAHFSTKIKNSWACARQFSTCKVCFLERVAVSKNALTQTGGLTLKIPSTLNALLLRSKYFSLGHTRSYIVIEMATSKTFLRAPHMHQVWELKAWEREFPNYFPICTPCSAEVHLKLRAIGINFRDGLYFGGARGVEPLCVRSWCSLWRRQANRSTQTARAPRGAASCRAQPPSKDPLAVLVIVGIRGSLWSVIACVWRAIACARRDARAARETALTAARWRNSIFSLWHLSSCSFRSSGGCLRVLKSREINYSQMDLRLLISWRIWVFSTASVYEMWYSVSLVELFIFQGLKMHYFLFLKSSDKNTCWFYFFLNASFV